MTCQRVGCKCGDVHFEISGSFSPNLPPDNPIPPSERVYPGYVHPRDCPKCGTPPADRQGMKTTVARPRPDPGAGTPKLGHVRPDVARGGPDRPGLGLLAMLPHPDNPYKRFDSAVVLLAVAGVVALALFGCGPGPAAGNAPTTNAIWEATDAQL